MSTVKERFDALSPEERERLQADGLVELSKSPDPFKRMFGSVIKTVFNLLDFAKSTSEKNRERNARLDTIERRLCALESQPLPKYCGVYERGKTYAANSLVTRQGGLWFAAEATMLTPGSGGPWRLIVKSGGVER